MGDQSKDIILSIRGMSKSFGRNRVLDHINLDVRKGWREVNNDEMSFWNLSERRRNYIP